eukprot:scaffold3015_cov122-Cylindrotheca_fusiformis.AAC.9
MDTLWVQFVANSTTMSESAFGINTCTKDRNGDSPKETMNGVFYVYTYLGKENEVVPRRVIHAKVDASVLKIADNAFDECRDLVSVQLPGGEEDEAGGNLMVIGEDAFSECTSLQSIIIPSTVKTIGKCCFFRCKSLVNVRLPDNLEVIDKVVFCGCYELQTINFPGTLREIRDEAFLNCDALVSVDLPEGLQSIQEGAFNWCISLGHVRIPSTVVEIGRCCFSRCERLLSIELPDGLQKIGESAFSECKALLHIAIPASTSHIGDRLFEGCEYLLASVGRPIDLLEKVKRRFEDCPAHELCYYHSNAGYYHYFPGYYHEINCTNGSSSLARRLEQLSFSSHPEEDDFGMSPFHILALSKRPSLCVWQLLMQLFPASLLLVSREDCFGNTPMEYLCHNGDRESISLATSLLELTIAERVRRLGLPDWRDHVWNLWDSLVAQWKEEEPEDRMSIFRTEIRFYLERYEQKERLSLLELAIWNCALERAKFSEDSSWVVLEGRARKKVKLDGSKAMNILDASDRETCRIQCGADTVIANVLPYLVGE